MAERYGGGGSLTRVFPIAAVVVVVALVGWLAWAMWDRADPKVTSHLEAWDVISVHEATAVVIVDLPADTTGASCKLRAYAEDHVTVGETSFVPVDGRQEVSIRTEREATSVEKVGCTADGQGDVR